MEKSKEANKPIHTPAAAAADAKAAMEKAKADA
jgi:hypothetical protein